MLRWLLVLIAVAALAAGGLVYSGIVRIPDRHNPWAALHIADPPGWLTRFKLGRIAREDALCRSVLAQAEMRYSALPDRQIAPGCAYDNAVLIESTSARIGASIALSCRSAVSLALWERHVLQPAARAHFGHGVARLEHFGSYACRNVNNRANTARSRHAVADALDVSAVVLANGRRISVREHWTHAGPEALFLRELHAGACRLFDGVLGPDYNAAHRDHFHLERGGYRVCR